MPHQSGKPDLVIGLMSGTSFDGVDAALVRLHRHGTATRVELVAFNTYPYPAAVRDVIAQASVPGTGTVDLVCRANMLVGELFAEAALSLCEAAEVPIDRVDLIGSHGQTIHHLPDTARLAGRPVQATLQIGEPSVIAERTGVTTVADFRPRDMACGGQGAPLVPYVDYLLFRHRTRSRVVLNIGGIANVTHLPPQCGVEDVLAFDTGPGNMLLDALTTRLTEGRRSFDRDGAMAWSGQVDDELLRLMMGHAYLRREPPKSTGRETFGSAFLQEVLRWSKDLTTADLLATAAAFTAESIHHAVYRYIVPHGPVDELLASGGGCHNRALMRHLREVFDPIPVRTTAELGIDVDAKEAVAFAILAHETIAGRPGNLPAATGASRRAILGKIVPGERLPW